MNPFSLEGKRILITGASSGIGRQIAISCAAMGATCVITGRDAMRVAETIAAMGGGEHSSAIADLTDSAQRNAVVEASGALDGVVHSAGITGLSPLRLATDKHLRDLYAINYEAPLSLTQRLLVKKSLRSGASILFLTSISAHIGFAGVGAYSGTKAALIGVMRCLALEVARQSIRVNSLSPSFVETPMVENARATVDLDSRRAQHPLGFGKPADVANAAVYFLSDASRWITGQTLILDGGFSIN